VLAHVHRYHPGHNAGAEAYLHAVLVDLLARGWEVQVVHTEPLPEAYTFRGVPVVPDPGDRALAGLYSWADVVVTHLHSTRRAVAWCRRGRPLVHLVHNHRALVNARVAPGDVDLAVWNSAWVEREHAAGYGHVPGLVVRPPVRAADYATERADRYEQGYTTLINLAVVKGGALFWPLAEARHDLDFLGVVGSYDLQQVPDPLPDNGLVIENTPDLREVYRATRVLLMPSHYESWGRCAVEAMASGIPVVCSPTPGLVEATTLNDGEPAALYADPGVPAEWLAALERLDDPDEYDAWSRRSLARSAELDQATALDLDLLAAHLLDLAGVPR
jgi:hypothetical protein